MMIKLVNFYHFRSRNTKSGPRREKAKQCHQASIGDQGTSEASITLSFEALVGASKGGKKAW
ncbi:hypothetical protein F383_27970 [Gossypium arboreum]|uniref:Uncharacterized protein n=1 Tax=Gossypium arboreum TaxID=29729 RepID=A0A0B0P748_GOSAR|nr:hypothetical protein F383_27970 [Gossypium arboreum]